MLELFEQCIFHGCITIDIIRCYAGLTTVQIFSKYDSFGSQLQVGALFHNARALSTQLQGNWCQMFCSLFHDFFSHRLTSGKENIIKFFSKKAGIFSASTGDNRDIFRGKTLTDHTVNNGAGIRGVSTWLDYNSIPCGNCIHQRLYGQQKWIVPWTHYQHHTMWRWLAITSGMKLCQRCVNPFLFCKGAHMLQHISDLA